MTEANPDFDAAHPSGHIVFRSCRGGYVHSVALSEAAMYTDAATLAEAIMLTADVSHLQAVMEVRSEILSAGHTPSDEVATLTDLVSAIDRLRDHQLGDEDAGA